MQISPVNNSQVKNKTQNESFKAFIANPTELRTINAVVTSLPKNIRENFKIYSMTDFIELAFPNNPKAVEGFQYFESPMKSTFLTKMEAKLLSSGSVETFSERILETIKKARKIDLLATTRAALDAKRENGSLQSISNLKEQLLGKGVPVYTMEEICMRGIDFYNNHIQVPCLGDYMSNIQISALRGMKKFRGCCLTENRIREIATNHSKDMFEYLSNLVHQQDSKPLLFKAN